MLTILLVRGLTLKGSASGIIYYIKPDFERLKGMCQFSFEFVYDKNGYKSY
jgi:SNF family Na+-dependent transporter